MQFGTLILIAFGLLASCAHKDVIRGDWCGSDRAQLEYHAKVLEACNQQNDLYACAQAISLCADGEHWMCVAKTPLVDDKVLAGCLEHERADGAACEASGVESIIATYSLTLSHYEAECAKEQWGACYEAGLVHQHRGEDAALAFRLACAHDVTAACERENGRVDPPPPPPPDEEVLADARKRLAGCCSSTTPKRGCVEASFYVTFDGTISLVRVLGIKDRQAIRRIEAEIRALHFRPGWSRALDVKLACDEN